MSYINPLAGSFAQSNQVARVQNENKSSEARRATPMRRSHTSSQAAVEREVDATDEVILQQEEEERHGEGRKKRKRAHAEIAASDDAGLDGLDLTA